jgi:UDP-glucose 4-epimerase
MKDALSLLETVAGRALQVTYGPSQTGDMQRTKADTGRIERELGWRAATPLRDGLSRHWQWAERARLTSR